MTKLTPHFTLAEMTKTSTGLPNKPNSTQLANLKLMAEKMEEVRAALGGLPIRVNSGFRSEAVNKKVGGSSTSQHKQGVACDFVCPAFGTPFEVFQAIIKAGITFDQLIYEQTWVHISIPAPRRQVLTYCSGKYTNGLVK